ncbi:type II toxin-antitoxin system RelE/ParE family toxin [Rhodoplanes sp. SY1]|uniref:type II toxin-antitoxin system RelE/ParE family toxin n=1 Tax=Rhodoplanes sp. SY1 TaxID=3166646 RepID=UPI0038B58795
MRLVFAAEARTDLLRIGDHIAADNPSRALSFVAEIEHHCARVLTMPRAYPLVPRHEASGIRRVVHGAYLIFYRVEADAVTILHVLHGAMDTDGLLFPAE